MSAATQSDQPPLFDFDLPAPGPRDLPPSAPSWRFQPPFWPAAALLAALLLYGIVSPLLTRGEQPSRDRSTHYADSLDALRMAKTAYYLRNMVTLQAPAGGKRRSSERMETEALDEYRKLTVSKTAGPADWRRLGILLFAFERPDGLKTLRTIATLPPPPAPKPARVRLSQPIDVVPKAKEAALWEAIYGPEPIKRRDVPAYRATLSRLNLNWFEHIAAASLYDKARMRQEAGDERKAAYAATVGMETVTTVQALMVVFGAFALGVCLFSRKARQNLAAAPSYKAALPTSRIPPFAPQAAIFTFVVYMGFTHISAGLPFRKLLFFVPDSAITHVAVPLSLLMYLPTVALALYVLRRFAASESEDRSMPTVREVLARIGFRADDVWLEVRRGIFGFTLCLPIVIVASLVSQYLFRRFETPPNPVTIIAMALQSPLDRLLVIVLAAVAAPIVEEMMFRGLLYPALRTRMSIPWAIFVSASVFSLAHPTLPGGFLPLASLGAAFTIAYQLRGGSLISSIVMHGLNNGLLMLTYFAVMAR